ncbi:MAG TPA: hypothetical protein VKA01_04855 [Vicinamibacteria bacterium]|nr:hypothetical protein [Vicinamibacteria bacterium]
MRALPLGLLLLAATAAAAQVKPKPQRDVPTLVTKDDAVREREAQERAGIPVARATHAEGRLEAMNTQGDWTALQEGARVVTGDRLRTLESTTARLDFPWVQLALGARSAVTIMSSRVLTAEVLEGRAEQRSEPGAHLMRMRTREAVVRGDGHVVVRREGEVTLVTVLEGRVLITSGGTTRAVKKGEGAISRPNTPPERVQPPVAPTALVPGADPAYVVDGHGVSLAWSGTQRDHVVQILELASDEVLVQREVTGRSVTVDVPWEGTFRWRVATRAPSGLEGLPSDSGYFCRVAR